MWPAEMQLPCRLGTRGAIHQTACRQMRRTKRIDIQRLSTANVLLTEASSMFLTHATLKRADRDLRLRVVSYLFGQHVSDLRHLDVEARRGVVTLRGRV